jgi:hypothetical protein
MSDTDPFADPNQSAPAKKEAVADPEKETQVVKPPPFLTNVDHSIGGK